MTRIIKKSNPLDTLFALCRDYPGGMEALAARVGIHISTLYEKLRPVQGRTNGLAFPEQVSEILFYLQDAKVPGWSDALQAFCLRHGFVAVTMQGHDLEAEHCPKTLLECVCEVSADNGVVAQVVAASVAGTTPKERAVSSREYEAVDEAILAAIQALVRLRSHMQAQHQADKAAGLVR